MKNNLYDIKKVPTLKAERMYETISTSNDSWVQQFTISIIADQEVWKTIIETSPITIHEFIHESIRHHYILNHP